MPDWKKIKTEYITTDISLRQLAEKYGVSMTTMGRKSSKEKWIQARQQHDHMVTTKVIEKSSAAKAKAVFDYNTTKTEIGNIMLQGIKELLEENPKEAIPIYKDLALAIQRIDGFSGWKSEADAEEQKARIENYRRQLDADKLKNEPIEIIMAEELEEFSQ